MPSHAGQGQPIGVSKVLLDLDGVIRHFDLERVRRIEAEHGLRSGCLHATAFDPELLEQVVTGLMGRKEWVEQVGATVGNTTAARECFDDVGVVDTEMLVEVDALRSDGVTVAVLTNGTDTIADELVQLGIAQRFDAVFNGAYLGVAKPDPRIFELVCSRLGCAPSDVFFTDDSASKLRGAIEIGMHARLFEGVEIFRAHLTHLGLRSSSEG